MQTAFKHAFNIAACTFGGTVIWSAINYLNDTQDAVRADPSLLLKTLPIMALGMAVGIPSVVTGFWRYLTDEPFKSDRNKDLVDLSLCMFGSMGIGKAFTDAATSSSPSLTTTAGVLLVGSALVGLGYKRVFSSVPKP